MPSPFGHALGGVLTAWLADLVPAGRSPRPARRPESWFQRAGDGLTVACAVLAAVPDVDLFFDNHRTVTHSVGAVCLVACATALVCVVRGGPLARIIWTCTAAYASHLLLDWTAVDKTVPRGVQLLWPFDHRFYISGWNVFRQTERRGLLSLRTMTINAVALMREIAILLPPLVAVWLIRVKAFARLATEVSGRDHPPQ